MNAKGDGGGGGEEEGEDGRSCAQAEHIDAALLEYLEAQSAILPPLPGSTVQYML